MKSDKKLDIISDKYITKVGDLKIISYIWGNSKLERIKPRMQVRIYKGEEKVFDKNYDDMPPTKNNLTEIETSILIKGGFYYRNNDLVTKSSKELVYYDIEKWENTLKKFISKYTSKQFNIKEMYQDIICNSEQANNYLSRKICEDIWN